MFRQHLRATPTPLVFACVFLFGAAFFTVRFPHVPGASVGSYFSTVLIAAPSVVALWRYFGSRKALLALALLSLFGYAIETTGVATGFPYGGFHYGGALGPKAFGLVPYLLPVSYVPLVIGAVAAPGASGFLPRILKSTLLLVLVDGVLDPGATALGFWVWPGGGPYYGIPASNYLGWLLSSALASVLLLALGGATWQTSTPRPGLLDSVTVAVSFWSGVAVFSGLAFPALLGFTLLAYLLYRRSRFRRGLRYKLGAEPKAAKQPGR